MPSVTTLPATNVLFDRCTLHGTSEGYDLSPQYTIVGWYGYYDGQNPGDAVPLISKYWSEAGAFEMLRTILASNIKYYCKAFIRIGGGTPDTYIWAPNWVDFTTPSILATIVTNSVQDIAVTTATGRGFAETETYGISPDVTGGENLTKRGVCWNTTGNPTVADNVAEEEGSFGRGAFTIPMTELPPETLIYVKAYGYNSIGYAYGDEVEFTTLAPIQLTVTTQAVTDIIHNSATGNGIITDIGEEDCTKRGVCWNTTGNPTIADDKSEETGSFGVGAFTRPITGLSEKITYYVKAYAYNPSVGYVYGAQVSFVTTPEIPVVTTQAVTDIEIRTATANGTIVSGVEIFERGFEYGLTETPTNSVKEEGVDLGLGPYSLPLSNL